jgi:hypothetical protein
MLKLWIRVDLVRYTNAEQLLFNSSQLEKIYVG